MIAFILTLLGRINTLLTRLSATRAGNLDYLDAAISTHSAIRSIQYGSIAMGTNTSATATIAAVTVGKTVLVHLGAFNSTSVLADYACTITLTNATTVTADRTGVGAGTTVKFVVAEFL